MTNTQYQHLGRAVELITEPASAVEGLHEHRCALIEELSKTMPNEQAREIVRAIMSEFCPTMHLGDRIIDVMLAMKGAAK